MILAFSLIVILIGIPLMQWGEKHDDPEGYRKRHGDDTFF